MQLDVAEDRLAADEEFRDDLLEFLVGQAVDACDIEPQIVGDLFSPLFLDQLLLAFLPTPVLDHSHRNLRLLAVLSVRSGTLDSEKPVRSNIPRLLRQLKLLDNSNFIFQNNIGCCHKNRLLSTPLLQSYPFNPSNSPI